MKKTKLLYVDDEEINLQLFKINLGNNYEIFTAETSIKALQILANNKDIKVVVSDMRMPYMNGVEFILKANEEYPDIHYYILSGYDISDEIKEAIDKGIIKKYFRKPSNLKKIGLEIENQLI